VSDRYRNDSCWPGAYDETTTNFPTIGARRYGEVAAVKEGGESKSASSTRSFEASIPFDELYDVEAPKLARFFRRRLPQPDHVKDFVQEVFIVDCH
jgi:hypothetical protein